MYCGYIPVYLHAALQYGITTAVSISVEFTLPEKYPDEVPLMKLSSYKGEFTEEQFQELKQLLKDQVDCVVVISCVHNLVYVVVDL